MDASGQCNLILCLHRQHEGTGLLKIYGLDSTSQGEKTMTLLSGGISLPRYVFNRYMSPVTLWVFYQAHIKLRWQGKTKQKIPVNFLVVRDALVCKRFNSRFPSITCQGPIIPKVNSTIWQPEVLIWTRPAIVKMSLGMEVSLCRAVVHVPQGQWFWVLLGYMSRFLWTVQQQFLPREKIEMLSAAPAHRWPWQWHYRVHSPATPSQLELMKPFG